MRCAIYARKSTEEQIASLDVQIDEATRYIDFEGNEITLDGATDKIMMALRGFAAELEREKIAGRTREHLETKARRGLNTGGRCYGYDNVPIFDGSQRTHVDYKINEEEAAIVLEVFEARAA